MCREWAQIEQAQRLICKGRGVEYVPSSDDSKTGFALGTKGLTPINGLRSPAIGATSGWYIWCGEQFSKAPDFFSPLHTRHIYKDIPEIASLLGLPPGFRFLLAGNYLDIWFDATLLDS